MTGFGRAEAQIQGKKLSVELRSLNSKSLDLNLKIPGRFREKEFEIRKILSTLIQRGKVDAYINTETITGQAHPVLQSDIIKQYIESLKKISSDAPDYEYLKMALRLPEAVSVTDIEVSDEENQLLMKLIYQSAEALEDFRRTEGKVLEQDIYRALERIEKSMAEILPFEKERIQIVRERYLSALKEFEKIDEARYFQEIAYYTEKLDISEEKVRLSQHIQYFKEIMTGSEANGKKLGFVTQEMGREINTMGSKANHHQIQQLVVQMKDDLERIKEQVLNIL